MIEAPFGSVSPMWSGVSVPGFAWFQTPMTGGALSSPGIAAGPQSPGRVFASGMSGGVPATGPLPGDAYAFSRGVVPAGTVPGFPTGGPSFGSTLMNGPIASMVGSDVPAGITAPALVMAVAMRRGQLTAPTSDQEIEDFVYDALDLLPGSTDVEVRSDGGRMTLVGVVSQKRLKRDIGEIAWSIPGINDVQNNITIGPRRKSRAQRSDVESPAVSGRKTA